MTIPLLATQLGSPTFSNAEYVPAYGPDSTVDGPNSKKLVPKPLTPNGASSSSLCDKGDLLKVL